MAMRPFFSKNELAELIDLTRECWSDQATTAQVTIKNKLRCLGEMEARAEDMADGPMSDADDLNVVGIRSVGIRRAE